MAGEGKNKKMIIKGVGTFLARKTYPGKDFGSAVVTLGTMQDLKIVLTTELDDIFGGDGIFAIDTLVKSKSIEVSATDAKFDLNALELMLGSSTETRKSNVEDYIWVMQEQQEIGEKAGSRESFNITVKEVNEAGAEGTIGFKIPASGDIDEVAITATLVGGESKIQIAEAIKSAINATLTHTATRTSVVVTVTATNVGDTANAEITGTLLTLAEISATDGYTDGSSKTTVAGEIRLNYQNDMYQTNTAGDEIDKDFESISVIFKDSNVACPRYTGIDETPPAGQYKLTLDASKKISSFTFNSSDSGRTVVVNYKKKETVDIFNLLTEDVPFNVYIVHHGSFLQKDGTYEGLETELYSCRAKGAFTIDAARGTASASTVSLIVLDPERADGKLGRIKRFNSSSKI